MDKKKKEGYRDSDIPTNTPLNPIVGVRAGTGIENVMETNLSSVEASVNEHESLEQANEFLAEKELQQERENL